MPDQSAAAAPGQLERVQQLQKVLLAKLDAFCTQHEIRYFLTAGSALGAVRHGDVIPWDDDIDIGMLRADYDRFLALTGGRLDDTVFVQTQDTDPGYPLFICKLRLDGTFFDEGVYTSIDMHHGIFVDIFPFDDIRSERGLPWRRLMAMAFLNLLASSVSRQICRQSAGGIAVRAIRWAAYALRHIVPRRAVHRWYDRLAKADSASGTDLVCTFDMYNLRRYRKTIFPRAGLVPTTPGPFGQMTVPLPGRTHDYLTGIFGDYMTLPPPEQRIPHHGVTVDFGPYGPAPD